MVKKVRDHLLRLKNLATEENLKKPQKSVYDIEDYENRTKTVACLGIIHMFYDSHKAELASAIQHSPQSDKSQVYLFLGIFNLISNFV